LIPPQNPPSKREARVARKLEQKLRQDEKSARLRERPENFAAIRAEQAPHDRTVRLGADPGSIYQMRMIWTANHADREGYWSWGHAREWGDVAWTSVIHPKLLEFERLLWREIERFTTGNGHLMHHSMAVEQICAESQGRLVEIDRVEDEIYRFRLGNRRRLWGYRIVNSFEILWYDPEHNIYPTDPD
jgi:hypothetical protein